MPAGFLNHRGTAPDATPLPPISPGQLFSGRMNFLEAAWKSTVCGGSVSLEGKHLAQYLLSVRTVCNWLEKP